MPFTTWTAFRTALLNAIQSHVEGQPMTGQVSMPDGTLIKYNGPDEARKWIEFADMMIARESAGSRSSRVSYGRHRRFR
jgi:hypothetical protein